MSHRLPEITFVIPARNEAVLVGRALAGVLAQQWDTAALEAIVVANDCSDDTAGEVRRFAAAHPELAVHLIELTEPGVANARNVGAREARAPLLLFVDADSWPTPFVAARAMAMWRSGTQVATFRNLADSRDLLDQSFFWIVELIMTVRRVRSFGYFIPRDLFLEHGGYDPAISLAETVEFFARLKAVGIAIGHTSTVIRTSPRRIRSGPLRIGWLTTFLQWTFASWGLGRRSSYGPVPVSARTGGREPLAPRASTLPDGDGQRLDTPG
jgi:glycosyltransferase involved in cell wall biosynthesis